MDINQNGKDDLQEIEAGLAQLAADAKALNPGAVIQDLKNGVAWTVDYIEKLTAEAQLILNAVITKVQGESKTLGEAVTNALNLLNSPRLHSAFGATQDTIAQLVAIGSDILTKVLAMVTGLKAAVGA